MSIPFESVRPRRHSLAWAMVMVAFIAVDLAVLRLTLPMNRVGQGFGIQTQMNTYR
jgi:hypothetical protein